MKYVVDTHTHSISSGHAYSTLLENVKHASEIGLKVLGTTDHGPKIPGAPQEIYFSNFRVLPRELYGVTLLYGCEANIINFEGGIDISERIQKRMDVVIASFHDICINSGTVDENTKALLKVMDNPYVDIIGHPGNPYYPIHAEEVVKKAKEKNILIEINNGSFISRKGSEENCSEIAALCKAYGVSVILGSDAHICFQIGNFTKAEAILRQVDMPEELIINTEKNRLINYLKGKCKLKDIAID